MRGPKFFREDENIKHKPQTRAAWFDDFAKSLETNKAIQAATSVQNITDYVSSIISNKSKHATVADVVNEYQELTGLKKHLQNIYSSQVKQAQQVEAPTLFPKLSADMREKILTFIRNRVEAYKGFVTILAIQEEVLNSFKADGISPQDVYDQHVSKFIATEIQKEQVNHPNDENQNLLGKRWHDSDSFEDENQDMFRNFEIKR